MEDYAEVRLVEILHKLGLTEEMVRHHVIRPDHLKAASLRVEVRDVGDGDDDPSNPPPPSGLFYRLNVQRLSRDLHDLLSGCVAGYAMHLRRYGRMIFDRQWNWSKRPENTPGDPGNLWASDVPMHVASFSKLITAMALTKLLYSRNISPDAHILPGLPKYWHKGPGVVLFQPEMGPRWRWRTLRYTVGYSAAFCNGRNRRNVPPVASRQEKLHS
jgi:hypothetical protein